MGLVQVLGRRRALADPIQIRLHGSFPTAIRTQSTFFEMTDFYLDLLRCLTVGGVPPIQHS